MSPVKSKQHYSITPKFLDGVFDIHTSTCVQDNPVLCTGPNSNFTSSIPDSEQILCNNQFPESNIIEGSSTYLWILQHVLTRALLLEWCCIDGVETCSDFMSCDSTLPNPFANTTVGQAVSLISQYSSATSSLTGISFIPFSTNGATISTGIPLSYCPRGKAC